MYFSSHTQYKSAEAKDPLHHLISQANKTGILSREEETALLEEWHRTHSHKAADKIVRAHLRLVAKIAASYRGYGLPMQDMVSEGAVGLMKALQRFDLTQEVRFSTYGVWWVHAQMKEYVLNHWCMLKIGTNRAQKKLFFSLRRLRNAMSDFEHGDSMTEAQINDIAAKLDVSEKSVREMEQRLGSRDLSLNVPIGSDGDDDGGEYMDILEDDGPNQEESFIKKDQANKRQAMLEEAFSSLKPRERDILTRRRIQERPDTLDTIGTEYEISRERVRQIENQAIQKISSLLGTLIPEDDRHGYL